MSWGVAPGFNEAAPLALNTSKVRGVTSNCMIDRLGSRYPPYILSGCWLTVGNTLWSVVRDQCSVFCRKDATSDTFFRSTLWEAHWCIRMSATMNEALMRNERRGNAKMTIPNGRVQRSSDDRPVITHPPVRGSPIRRSLGVRNYGKRFSVELCESERNSGVSV